MKKGFSYLELVAALGLLAILCSSFLVWQKQFVAQTRAAQTYYQERQTVLNRLARGEYDRTEQRDGYKYNEIIWRGKKVVIFSL